MKILRYAHTVLLLLLATITASAGMIKVSEQRVSGDEVTEASYIYFEEHGSGTPLIFLHGHTLDRRMWDKQVAYFSKFYRVIVFDFRGYGRSSYLTEGMIFTHADDVITVMDSLHIDKAHIVGLSMGGFVAGDMVGMYPERMLSCVMSSGAMRTKHPSVNDPVTAEEWKAQDEQIRKNKEQGIDNWKTEWIEKLITGGGSQQERIRKSLTQQVMDWDSFTLLHHEPHLYYGHEAYENLQQKRPAVPTMYMSGEKENKKSMGMLAYLPNSRQTWLPDCGHMSNMEQPDLFNHVIHEFLKSIDK